MQNPHGQPRNFQQGNNYQAPLQVMQPNPEQKKNDLEGVILQFIITQQQTNAQTIYIRSPSATKIGIIHIF